MFQIQNCLECNFSWNSTIFNIIRRVVWCSKFYFLFHNLFSKILSIDFFIFYNVTKIKIKSFECPKSKPATHCFIFSLSNNALTIRCLVSERIYPASQHIILKIVGFLKGMFVLLCFVEYLNLVLGLCLWGSIAVWFSTIPVV